MADGRDLGRQFFEDMLNTGDFSVADRIFDPNIVMYHPSSPEPVRGAAAVKGFLGAFRAGFPDLKMTVDDVFASGDRVAVRWHSQGTHTEVLFGIPPTGKTMSVKGISILRVENGRIVEDWVAEDSLGLMKQLGLIPA